MEVLTSPWGTSRTPVWPSEGLWWLFRLNSPAWVFHPCWSDDLRIERKSRLSLGVYGKLVMSNSDVDYELRLAGAPAVLTRRWELWRSSAHGG